MKTRHRFAVTTLLLVAAFAATSFAVAADSDRVAQPPSHASTTYVPKIVDPALAPIDAAAEDLAWAARDVMSSLQGLDINAANGAIARGDSAAASVTAQLAKLGATNPAAAAAATLPGLWQTIKTRATAVATLLADLKAHNDGLIWAANFARQGSWSDALASMDQAQAALDRVRADRANLGQPDATRTLDDLMARYEAYDSASRAQYKFLGKGHRHQGVRLTKLNSRVALTQAALPDGMGFFSSFVDEISGTPLSATLAQIGVARAIIDATLNPPMMHPQ